MAIPDVMEQLCWVFRRRATMHGGVGGGTSIGECRKPIFRSISVLGNACCHLTCYFAPGRHRFV